MLRKDNTKVSLVIIEFSTYFLTIKTHHFPILLKKNPSLIGTLGESRPRRMRA